MGQEDTPVWSHIQGPTRGPVLGPGVCAVRVPLGEGSAELSAQVPMGSPEALPCRAPWRAGGLAEHLLLQPLGLPLRGLDPALGTGCRVCPSPLPWDLNLAKNPSQHDAHGRGLTSGISSP